MFWRIFILLAGAWYLLGVPLLGQDSAAVEECLRRIDTTVIKGQSRGRETSNQVAVEGIRKANRMSSAEWKSIVTREGWESFRAVSIERLHDSLGTFPDSDRPPAVHVTGASSGDGFRIENLVFESRSGLWVTANLYVPEPQLDSMPGILICHSHHNPKTQGELQDMGMTWARWGCLTLVMDQLGHGERRDHPFNSADDYFKSFRVGRQDYYFRYNLGIQLHLIGESLVGWMVWDLMRGVDLLLAREGIDANRIILLGAVAGGGDPAAITAALDQRIAAAVPLNFGGPQGYHPYPLPDDALHSFNYAGSGSWESTRNLRLSCRDGFLPWVIVGAIAPRPLLYAHEFSWDRERDPVWKRLQKIYGEFYEAPENLDYSHGFGVVRMRPPEASHCNNIGPVQRERMHQAFHRWFGVVGSPETEYSNRRDSQELVSMTTRWERELRPLKLHEKTERLVSASLTKAREDLKGVAPAARLQWMQQNWRALLGSVEPAEETAILSEVESEEHGIEVSRILIQRETTVPEARVLIPLVIMRMNNSDDRVPVVIGVSQGGKGEFLQKRAEGIASLLSHGLAVCLADLRGTGETVSGIGRGRTSQSTEISSSLLMLGETRVGQRLSDLRTVLNFLRSQSGIDAGRVIVWGDSLRQPNGPETDLSVPMGIEDEPQVSEPLGGLLGLLMALYEPDVRAVYARGCLVSFQSVLSSPFCYLPHDMVIPGVIPAGDLTSLLEVLDSPRIRLEGLVDGLNRQVPEGSIRELYPGASTATKGDGPAEATAWMLQTFELPQSLSKPTKP